MYDGRVPYSKVGLQLLAQAMNVTTAAIWVNPVSNSFGLRESAFHSPTSVIGVDGDHGSEGVVPSRPVHEE